MSYVISRLVHSTANGISDPWSNFTSGGFILSSYYCFWKMSFSELWHSLLDILTKTSSLYAIIKKRKVSEYERTWVDNYTRTTLQDRCKLSLCFRLAKTTERSRAYTHTRACARIRLTWIYSWVYLCWVVHLVKCVYRCTY